MLPNKANPSTANDPLPLRPAPVSARRRIRARDPAPVGADPRIGPRDAPLRLSRAEYIRRAIQRMNQETRTKLRAQRLAEVSRRVRDESMRVNTEFAAFERNPDAR